jgi:hypothetical protein
MSREPIVPLDTRLLEHRLPYECRTLHPYWEVVEWLEDNVGTFDQEWYRYGTDIAQGIVAGADFYDYYRFRDEQAAILFKLKWS